MSDQTHPTIFPALRYRDADAAIDWLGRAFGFREKAVYRGEDGAVQHAELTLGTGLVMLGQYSEEGWMGGHAPDPLAGTVSLYLVVDDPDAHHDRAKVAGAQIVRELADQEYGSREYSARDPEGNLWSFGTYQPMPDHEPLLRSAYVAFNARDVDAALELMRPDVDWPNAWEGGRVVGHAAVRDYWTRQFAEISSKVEPERFTEEPDGSITVDVRQVVHDAHTGEPISETNVSHSYRIRDGKIARMDVLEADAS